LPEGKRAWRIGQIFPDDWQPLVRRRGPYRRLAWLDVRLAPGP